MKQHLDRAALDRPLLSLLKNVYVLPHHHPPLPPLLTGYHSSAESPLLIAVTEEGSKKLNEASWVGILVVSSTA